MITDSDEQIPLIPVFVPSLVTILLHQEKEKRSPLTEEEVLKIRDHATVIMLPLNVKVSFDQKRGYKDLNPNHCFEEWQEFRSGL